MTELKREMSIPIVFRFMEVLVDRANYDEVRAERSGIKVMKLKLIRNGIKMMKLIGLKLIGLACGGMLVAALCGLDKRWRLRAMMFSVQRLCLVKRMLPFRKALVGLAAGVTVFVGLAVFPVVFSSFVHGQQTVLSPYPPAQGFIIKCSCVNTASYTVLADAGICL